jgi:hypothetical protein
MRFGNILLTTLLLLASLPALADGIVRGRVVDATTGGDIAGLSAYIDGTGIGTPTALDGTFSLRLPEGKTTLTFSHISYRQQRVDVDVRPHVEICVDVRMEPEALTLGPVTVTAGAAIPRHTPVALSVVDRRTIETKISNLDFPELLKATPGVYTTRGVGASRLSYKGYGESQPVADNTTTEGRRQNRRVELRIVEE